MGQIYLRNYDEPYFLHLATFFDFCIVLCSSLAVSQSRVYVRYVNLANYHFTGYYNLEIRTTLNLQPSKTFLINLFHKIVYIRFVKTKYYSHILRALAAPSENIFDERKNRRKVTDTKSQ